MTPARTAILVDSCSDVPEELRRKYGMYVVPMTMIYGDAEYRDGVDITTDDVYARFPQEIPTTSLPSPSVVADVFRQIKADGYEKVIAVAISSGLSGTFEMLRGFGPAPEGLETCYVDTKNIGIGSGFTAIRAGELIEQGLPFAEVCREVENAARHTKLFFCVSTLSYLVKGGRIGLVAGLVGSIFDLKPVISCNDDGVYYTVVKTRGRKKSLQLALAEGRRVRAGRQGVQHHGDARSREAGGRRDPRGPEGPATGLRPRDRGPDHPGARRAHGSRPHRHRYPAPGVGAASCLAQRATLLAPARCVPPAPAVRVLEGST